MYKTLVWWNFIQDSSYETMGASLIQGIMLLKKHVEIEKWKMKNEKRKKYVILLGKQGDKN